MREAADLAAILQSLKPRDLDVTPRLLGPLAFRGLDEDLVHVHAASRIIPPTERVLLVHEDEFLFGLGMLDVNELESAQKNIVALHFFLRGRMPRPRSRPRRSAEDESAQLPHSLQRLRSGCHTCHR